ncbi:hypothetical protein ABVT39_027740 [Epinephelus coioides]
MAQKGVELDRETFSCSICLDLLKDPGTLHCGHSYCINCIQSFWDGEDEKRIYSCPQCRQSFTPRPVLMKNIMLADLVEKLKKTGLQAAPADHCYAGAEDVDQHKGHDTVSAAAERTERQRELERSRQNIQQRIQDTEKDVKLLQQEVEAISRSADKAVEHSEKIFTELIRLMEKRRSDVKQQLRWQQETEKHKLVEPSKKLQENICSRHDEVMKMFCRTDQQCICYLCSVDEHKGHDTVSAAAERTERQRELERSRQNIQQRIQDTEKDVKLLQQEVEAISRSADKAVEHSEKIFTELIRLMEKRRSDVKQQLRWQQETEDPGTLHCGHSYCINCIQSFWDGEDEKRIYSCPQCRQSFTPRPVLRKNTMLAVLVEQLKKTGLQAAPADHCYAGAEDVDQHKGHDTVSAAAAVSGVRDKKLQENICSRHDEVMKMFCRTDQQCICYLCSVDEHKGHDTVSAAAERSERQRELEGSRQNIQQRIQDTEKDVKLLQQEVEAISRSADKAVEHSEKIFTELIRLMEKRRSDVKQQLRWQQETEDRPRCEALPTLRAAVDSLLILSIPEALNTVDAVAVSTVKSPRILQ